MLNNLRLDNIIIEKMKILGWWLTEKNLFLARIRFWHQVGHQVPNVLIIRAHFP